MASQNNSSKAQSAMEYLMTYGWAILIIAVVLAILFSLNVFSPHLGTDCVGATGYSCSGITLNSAGLLSFEFGQGTGVTVYNAQFSCTASPNGFAVNALSYSAVSQNGVAIGNSLFGSGPYKGQSANIISTTSLPLSGLQCFTTSQTTSFAPIGTSLTGTIWMAYNTSQIPGAAANQYVKIASFSAQSTS